MTTDNFCFYLQIRLIQTSQTGGQWYSDASPFSIPCLNILVIAWTNLSQGSLTKEGRLSTVDLLVLMSLDQLIFKLKILLTFFYKTSYLNEEVICTELTPSVNITCLSQQDKIWAEFSTLNVGMHVHTLQLRL